MKQSLVLFLLLMSGLTALAQVPTVQKAPPKWDIYLGYGLTRVGSSNITPAFNSNGGIVQFQWHFGSRLSVLADFNGSTKSNVNNQRVDQALYSFMAGPRYSFPVRQGKQIVFAEGLFGYSRSQSNISIPGTIPITQIANNQWNFSMMIAGGTELRVTPKIWFRPAEVGYYMTTFPAIAVPGVGVWNSSGRQNDLRYSVGLRFGF
jgi:opacity protein-like surface antigen